MIHDIAEAASADFALEAPAEESSAMDAAVAQLRRAAHLAAPAGQVMITVRACGVRGERRRGM